MGMLRVDHVADHEEGLCSAARDDHGASPEKQGADRKIAVIKYVDCRYERCWHDRDVSPRGSPVFSAILSPQPLARNQGCTLRLASHAHVGEL